MATINFEGGASGVRICQLQISTGGVQFKNPIKATVKHNRWYQANAFECKIALYGDPAHDLAFWGSNGNIGNFPIEITFIVDGASQTMMVGQTDKVSVDAVKGVVTVHGRDNAALLIDTMTKETFTNQHVIDIVTALAGRVGLNVDIDDGSEYAGTLNRDNLYILNIGATFGHAVSYWDLVAWMAKTFHYYMYVDGDTLYFHRLTHDADTWQVIFIPPNDDTGPVIKLNPSNVTALTLTRDYNIARNTSVLVYSYDAVNKTTNQATNDNPNQYGGEKPTMQFMVAGLKDTAAAQNLANSLYDNAITHEKKISWSEPGDLYLSCQEQAELVPAGATDFHQKYFIESIDRMMDFKGGFDMQITATNSDPELSNNAGI